MDDPLRTSLNKALISKNYSHAFDKIKNNITKFCENLQKLQDILQKLSNNNNSSNNLYDENTINSIILETSNLLSETFDLINDIKEYNYDNKNEKIENITEANNLTDECNNYKNIFENLINKIKIKNTRLIRKAKNSLNSFLGSNFSINSNNSMTNTNTNNTNSNNNNINEIDKKLSINKIIEMTNFKLNSKIERRNTIKDFLINETKYENIDEKNNEKYVNSILNAKPGNCFTRNIGYYLLIFVIIVVIICIYFKL